MRIAHVAAGVAASAVLLASPAAAEEKGATTQGAEPPVAERPGAEHQVKVSLSRENPDVRTAKTDAKEIDFFLFIDGDGARGCEIGIVIDGGKLVRYVIDTERPWVALPLANPYPGTVAQVGTDCYETPVLLGTMTVRPNEPGGRVALDIVPSARNQEATVIRCDQTGTPGFRAIPAAANGEPAAPHPVAGDGTPPADAVEAPEHQDHDHAREEAAKSSGG